MTPAEKAKELVEKFYYLENGNDEEWDISWYGAKCCALIAVEEILNAYEYGGASSTQDINYWQSVKSEISNL